MGLKLVDLHAHSTASDGSESPEEVVRLAARAGLRAVALTDHDTTGGLAAAEAEAGRDGIEFVRGCEISTATQWGEAHFLGLWIPRDESRTAPLQAALEAMRMEREARNRRIAGRLQNLGFDIDYERVRELAGGGVTGRPHFAEMLCRMGVTRDRKEAFRLYLGEGAAAYEPRRLMPPVEAVGILHACGALACMAHPRLLRASVDELASLLGPLADAGLDALEAYHSEHNAGDVRECVALAARFGLGLSGGSDFHGAPKPGISLGTGKGGLRVTEHCYEQLLALRDARGLGD